MYDRNHPGTGHRLRRAEEDEAPREVTFFDSEAKAQVLFSFKSRQIIDMAATTDVFDNAGATIGVFRRTR